MPPIGSIVTYWLLGQTKETVPFYGIERSQGSSLDATPGSEGKR